MSGRHGPRWIVGGDRERQRHHEAITAAIQARDRATAMLRVREGELDGAIRAAIDAGLSYREVGELTGQGKSLLHMRFPRSAAQ